MFREMRRKKQELSIEDTRAVLERGSSGVLAVLGDEGYPYAVPLSYVYCDDKIYFHCAKTGHKIDAIMTEPKVSFCVIDEDQIVQSEYTTYFRSAIAFGKARILETPEEKKAATRKIALKYSPDYEEGIDEAIAKEMPALCTVEISIDHLTGKEAIEFVRARQPK